MLRKIVLTMSAAFASAVGTSAMDHLFRPPHQETASHEGRIGGVGALPGGALAAALLDRKNALSG